IVAPHPREWVERRGGAFVRRVGLADLEGAETRRRKADITVAAEQGAGDLIAQIAIRLFVAWKCGNVESGFELIDEAQIGVWQLLEAAHAEIGQVGRDVGHPAEIAARSTDAAGAAAVRIGRAREPAPDALGGAVER